MTDVLLCVGNSMMGDDGAGPLLAEMCAANPAGQWVVIDGGSAPENDIVAIRELRPERLLIVDATDMGLNPGAAGVEQNAARHAARYSSGERHLPDGEEIT